MNILVLGGSLTPDVPAGESFAERVAQRLADAQAAPVVIDLAAPGGGTNVLHRLRRLPLRLADYDLILLSLGTAQRPDTWRGRFNRMWQLGAQTRQLFALLAAHRQRVLVLGPTPCLPPVSNGFQRWASYVLGVLCRRCAFRLVDGFRALPRQAFVFAPDGQTLNKFGHHYLALGIIEFLSQRTVGSESVVN